MGDFFFFWFFAFGLVSPSVFWWYCFRILILTDQRNYFRKKWEIMGLYNQEGKGCNWFWIGLFLFLFLFPTLLKWVDFTSTYSCLWKWKSESVSQLCLTLCDSIDYSPPGFSAHGILQLRILEWVAISFSRGSSWPRDQTWVSCMQADSLPSEPLGKPSLAFSWGLFCGS